MPPKNDESQLKIPPESHHLLPILGIIAFEDSLVRDQITAIGAHGHLVCQFNFLRGEALSDGENQSLSAPLIWVKINKMSEFSAQTPPLSGGFIQRPVHLGRMSAARLDVGSWSSWERAADFPIH